MEAESHEWWKAKAKELASWINCLKMYGVCCPICYYKHNADSIHALWCQLGKSYEIVNEINGTV
jgi:hypothetical protein